MNPEALAYPRHLHRPVSRASWDAGERSYCVVKNAEECRQRLAEGYGLDPVIVEPGLIVVPPPSGGDDTAGIQAAVDAAVPLKRPVGRPRKVQP